MIKTKTIDEIEKLYTNNLKKHGVSSKSVGWPDEKAHILRFDKLFNSVILEDINALNDLGSGYGSVLNYLTSKNKHLKKYFPYDISQKMLDALNVEHYPNTHIEKMLAHELKTVADFSIASGIFNVRFSENEKIWTEHIIKTLHNLNDFSTKGFSFNLLSTYVDFKKAHLYYGDPLLFFDYCKKNFSRYVSIYHDYPLWEWTIVVKK